MLVALHATATFRTLLFLRVCVFISLYFGLSCRIILYGSHVYKPAGFGLENASSIFPSNLYEPSLFAYLPSLRSSPSPSSPIAPPSSSSPLVSSSTLTSIDFSLFRTCLLLPLSPPLVALLLHPLFSPLRFPSLFSSNPSPLRIHTDLHLYNAIQKFGKLKQGELLTAIAQVSTDTGVLRDGVKHFRLATNQS